MVLSYEQNIVKQEGASHTNEKVGIAVYDFDGTCIRGNSPVLLVRFLLSKKLLKPSTAARIASWALRYKFRLPQNESLVRGLVFEPFCGKPSKHVDEYLKLFYDEVVSSRWRTAADEQMKQDAYEGLVVMVVSASWQAIVARAQEFHPFQYAIATSMVKDAQGNYTRRVDGLPIEGIEKLHAIQRVADKEFGEGNWELVKAYGDHHSDRPMLFAAQRAYAVTPDVPLTRTAKAQHWEILDWS